MGPDQITAKGGNRRAQDLQFFCNKVRFGAHNACWYLGHFQANSNLLPLPARVQTLAGG